MSGLSPGINTLEKPSIYSKPDQEIVLVETHTEIERSISRARRATTSFLREGHDRVQSGVSRWIGVEHAVESRVKDLYPKHETLTPGILYVGVATLSGSVIARNRSIFWRALLPPTLLILSMNYFLPETSHNLGEYGAELEERYCPTLATHRLVATHRAREALESARNTTARGRERWSESVENGVVWAQDATGLQLREALGWGSRVEKRAEQRFAELKEEASDAFAEAGKKAEDTVKDARAAIDSAVKS